jgi:beta-lactam-binding protein with PASTA domain/predicted Ser/Thr protein kinase
VSEVEPGSVVDGRYRVISRLGAGGMADVFLAEDEQLGRKVALKLLHRRFAEDPDFVERFRREARAAASLQHPNVVQVYDRGGYDGIYYIAMEYLPGRSLKQLIRQEAPLEPLRVIDIATQILKAARFAHQRGVIHRDLKPHNVIVDEDDGAKVTDFGIARAGASDMTETGSIMGTAQYLSPEQAQGHPVSERSDLYSVGVVMYEMLTGRVPFEAESAVTIALKHVSEAPVSPRDLNPDVPRPLEQVVLWALNKNPADRPADADEFIRVLGQVREAIAAGSPDLVTAKMAAIMAGAVGTTAALPTAVIPTAAPVPYQLTERPVVGEVLPFEEPPPPDDPGRSPWPWVALLLILLLLGGGGLAVYLLTRPAQGTVPRVVGYPLSVAQADVSNAGFRPYVVNEPSSQPAGQVIRQSPLGGSAATKGSTVTLTVSSGPQSVSIPSVVHLPQGKAERRLRRARLKIGQLLPQYSSAIPKGDATRTDPGAGQSVPAGTAVTLYVSSGPAPISVPNTVGDTEAAAKAALSAFTVRTTSQTTTSQPAGTVVSQAPSGGTALPNSVVNLVIASAPTTVKVPGVVGFPWRAARRQLRSAGFTVVEHYQAVGKQSRSGVVLSQAPSAGSKQPKGSTVTIVIGKYTKPSGGTGTGTKTGTGTGTSTTSTTPTGTSTSPTSTTGG